MRLADAPPPGWYPDPAGGSRLRWWEGTDWSDEFRAPPTASQLEIEAHHRQRDDDPEPRAAAPGRRVEQAALTRRDADEIIAEVRKAARSEVDRATELFSQRARAATREIQPLISEYTNLAKRWFRVAVVIVPLVIVAWFVFEAVVQASFLEWVGDRIDGLTD